MAGRPPISRVPRVVVCRACGEGFRTWTSWRPGTPAYRRVSCAWCGASQLIGRTADP